MGTYQLHAIACNLDLSTVGREVKSAQVAGFFFFFSKSVPISVESIKGKVAISLFFFFFEQLLIVIKKKFVC